MTDLRTLVEQEMDRAGSPTFYLEDVADRRDRKGRYQRISAGVVGIAVFVAAVWIVTSRAPSDRTQTPGSAPTPGSTGPTVAGPTVAPEGNRFIGLPPADAEPSGPRRGELVASDWGIHPFYAVYVYADGRLIWERDELDLWPPGDDFPEIPNGYTTRLLQRRLTPEGVELLRSGAVPLDGQDALPASELPARAWADAEFEPYVPSRYAICFWPGEYMRRSSFVDGLPAPARDLLRGREWMADPADGVVGGIECLQVTTDEARALNEIFLDAGYRGDPLANAYELQYEFTATQGTRISMVFEPILPHGAIVLEGG